MCYVVWNVRMTVKDEYEIINKDTVAAYVN
jgi:hypothetical protein